MTTLDFDHLISEITNELSDLPYAQRKAAVRAYQQALHEDEATALNFVWSLQARDSQLPPPGDWNTWMILAGRGFGKTRTGAEWVRARVETGQAGRIALVARTLPEAQSIMIEGESGLLNISPPWHKPTYEPSKRKLTWPNGAHALAFSSHEPDQLRGPQFDAAWCDELASWEYPAQTWDNLTFALQPRTTATLRRHHNAQVHRAGQYSHQRPGRPRHTRHHVRQQRQPRTRILRRHNRTVRRHPHRPAGDLRRAHRRRRRRTLETRVDREGTTPQPPTRSPYRSRHRPRHVRQAQQLRDRHRRSRSRYAPRARLRPSRRVRQANPQLLGPPRNPPLRQVQRHPHHRRGQRRRRPRQVHPQGRRPPHTTLQGHQGPTRQIHQGRTRRRPLRAEPAPYPDTGAASTTSAASPCSKTRCVPGPPTSAHPTPQTAPTP